MNEEKTNNLVVKTTKWLKVSSEDKLKIISDAIEVGAKGIIKDDEGYYIIQRSSVHMGYPIGHWIATARNANLVDKDFVESLKGLKVRLDKLRRFLSAEEKLDIIKKAIDAGINGISLGPDGKYVVSNSCRYMNFYIGSSIVSVRQGKIKDQEYIEGLKNLNISFTENLTYERKLDIIADAIKNNIEGISYDELGRVVFAPDCDHMGFKIGESVLNIKAGAYSNINYKKGLTRLNVALDKCCAVLTTEQRLAIIKSAIANGGKGIIKTKSGDVAIRSTCRYKDYPIGSWVELAILNQDKNDEMKKGLKALNISYNRNLVNAVAISEKIQKAIDNNAEGITKLPIDKIHINSTCQYEGLAIGSIISRIISNNHTNKELIEFVKAMNIIVDRREREVGKRLMELMNIINNKSQGVYYSPEGKITIDSKLWDIGKVIKKVNLGEINNEMFIKD